MVFCCSKQQDPALFTLSCELWFQGCSSHRSALKRRAGGVRSGQEDLYLGVRTFRTPAPLSRVFLIFDPGLVDYPGLISGVGRECHVLATFAFMPSLPGTIWLAQSTGPQSTSRNYLCISLIFSGCQIHHKDPSLHTYLSHLSSTHCLRPFAPLWDTSHLGVY